MNKKYFYLAALALTIIVSMSANNVFAEQRTPNNNSYWANKIIMDVVNAKTADDFMKIANSYWSNWRNEWLAKYGVYAFGVTAKDHWDLFNQEQKDKINNVIKDATSESTFHIDADCGLWKGNSCSEDYASMVIVIAMTKNLYPDVANQIGEGVLDQLEQKYINKTFSTHNGFYSLVKEKMPWDNSVKVKMYNHGEENPVYAGILIMDMNNARYMYLKAGNRLPYYYRNSNMTPLFNWTQEKAFNDGRAYLPNACHKVNDTHDVVPCNDRTISNTFPKLIPSGRFMSMVFGYKAFLQNKFNFLAFSDAMSGGNFNKARYYFYNVWNPLYYSAVVRTPRRIIRRVVPTRGYSSQKTIKASRNNSTFSYYIMKYRHNSNPIKRITPAKSK